jgi:hypothetical protein
MVKGIYEVNSVPCDDKVIKMMTSREAYSLTSAPYHCGSLLFLTSTNSYLYQQ